MRLCLIACVHACVRARLCVCVCVRNEKSDRGREKKAFYLTSEIPLFAFQIDFGMREPARVTRVQS